jgi:K+-transporting ATPase A subunit
MMAVAGSLVAKKKVPASVGTFPTHGPLFVGLLVGVIVIIGGLTFLPRTRARTDRPAAALRLDRPRRD